MWGVDTSAFEDALLRMNSEDVTTRLAPFLDSLEGGSEGQLYNDIVDYFYYFQIRREGEDCMQERILQGSS